MIDLDLIKECREGSISSFRKLINLTTQFAFPVAFRMLGDEEKAKDVIQETMVTVWQKLGGVRSPEAYRSWVYRIVVNKCYDEMRRRKSNPEFSADERTWTVITNTLAGESGHVLEKEETAGIINLLTSRLSPKQKAVFVLHELEQMSGEEISSITGMSKMLIKSNLHYARRKMAEMIEKYYSDGNRRG